MPNDFKILFLGDIVGRAGRNVVKKFLENNKGKYDFVIANVENASHGFGLTQKNHDEIIAMGVNCFTSGNHIWDKKDIFQYVDTSNVLIRPLNYPNCKYGVGYRVFDEKIVIINMLGRTFMESYLCPFDTLKKLNDEIDFQDKLVIVDFHAEATAEKICFAKYASMIGVKAVFGTHTHVQTADETIIDKNCAYITDAGFCGASEGVIGMEYQGSYNHFVTLLPERFEVIDKPTCVQINGVEAVFDKNNKPKSISRIFENFEVKNEN